MAKKNAQPVKRLPQEQAVLIPVAQEPAFKKSEVSKAMRKMLNDRETCENNAIIAAFKEELKNPAATEASVRATLTPTANSTIVAEIVFKNGTILKTTLTKPLRGAYDQAEQETKVVLKREFEEQFNARPAHTTAQLKELDVLCRKAEKPFKGKFR